MADLDLGGYSKLMFPMSGPNDNSGLDVCANRPLDPIVNADGSRLAGTVFVTALMDAAEYECDLPVKLPRRLMDEFHPEGLPLALAKLPTGDEKRRRTEPSGPQERRTADKWSNQFDQLLACGILGLATTLATGLQMTLAIAILFYSTYFAVPKGEAAARAIFNGARVSKEFLTPPPTNLMAIHEFVREASKMGRCHMITGDIRHWFHLIGVPLRLQRWFGLISRDKKYVWTTLPMGFSWSPHIAQLFAWTVLLAHRPDENALFPPVHHAQLPRWRKIFDSTGRCLCLSGVYYDNFINLIVEDREDLCDAIFDRIQRNAKRFNVTMKHLDKFTCDELSIPNQEAEPKRKCVTLGLQFLMNHHGVTWRHDPEKVVGWGALTQSLQGTGRVLARIIARIIGTIIWHQTILLRPYGDIAHVLAIMRDVAAAAARDSWETSVEISGAQRRILKNHLERCILNKLIVEKACVPLPLADWFTAFTDSSRPGWGTFITGPLAPGRLPRIISEEKGGWSSSWIKHIIMVKEVVTACKTVTELVLKAGRPISVTLVIDNSAGYYSISRGYSSNLIANEYITKLYAALRKTKSTLEVLLVPSKRNIADPPSRGHVTLTGTEILPAYAALFADSVKAALGWRLGQSAHEYDHERAPPFTGLLRHGAAGAIDEDDDDPALRDLVDEAVYMHDIMHVVSREDTETE
jgi:hypothetical protein